MSDSVYKIIELVGTSSESWEKAAANAIAKASESLRELRIAEVTAMDVNIKDGKIESYIHKTQFENTEGFRLDKSYKLFARLTIPAALRDIDAVFASAAAFFSQEDALLRIFLGRYAEKTQPLTTGYLKTNEVGVIENGIIWTATNAENGTYDLYNKGKIIKKEIQNLTDFQETILDYFKKYRND